MTIERSPARDAALDALMPLVAQRGWTMPALREAAGPDADLLFPGGAPELIEAQSDLADRRMEKGAANAGLAGLRLPERVRAVIAIRLRQNRPFKEALRRAPAVLVGPRNAVLAARILARTVDTIWHAAGDRSADFSWYTKRAILASVYASTALRWLADQTEDDAETLAFLDRRLAGVARIGHIRERMRQRGG